MAFFIIEGDITELEVDCIVNAANPQLLMGGGVCGAIFKAAGVEELDKACRPLAPIKTSQAVITPGFDLKAGHIIHTAGPVYHGGDQGEEELLRNSYLNSLRLAKEKGCESIAFPLISSGIYGYPREEALLVARQAIGDFLKEQDLDVYLVIFSRDDFPLEANLADGLDKYLQASQTIVMEEFKSAMAPGLEDHLAQASQGFKAYLFELIDSSGLTDVQVYKRANLDRRLFSKIKNLEGYRPSKNTVLALSLGLGLDLESSDRLLEEAGYAFSPSSRSDLIIQYFIINKDHNIYRVNEALFNYGEKLLGSNDS